MRIGPADHGQAMTLEQFRTAEWIEGYQYEMVDGRLYVTRHAEPAQDIVENWLFWKVRRYADRRPVIVNYVTNKARVYVPDRLVTDVSPDVALYRDFPVSSFAKASWDDVRPFLVCEVVSVFDPEKDLVRNVELYLQVPSIKEYWLIDNREQATMNVYRKYGRRWILLELAFGDIYTTKLLPGFRLVIDPRK